MSGARVVAPGTAQTGQRQQDFTADPGWHAYRNRLRPDEPRIVRQDFGWRETNHARGRAAGEIGGWVQRSPTPAYYAMPIETRTLDDRLTASGRFAVPHCDNGCGVLIGWFRDDLPGWRTPNSLAFRLDGNGGDYWVLFEYGTRSRFTGGGATFDGQYQTTSTPPFLADGTVHEWSFVYDPEDADAHGEITFTIDGQTYTAPLEPGHREDGAEFNRFGIWNQQLYGDGMEVYFDDLVIDGEEFRFDHDPEWTGVGNAAEFQERFIRPLHNFGYSPTAYAGGEEGEIGGIVWRGQPACYADRVGPLTLDDELVASGRINMRSAGVDSAFYFGWFDSASLTGEVERSAAAEPQDPGGESVRRNFLGICIEGPSRIGHYFRPQYVAADGEDRSRGDGPLLRIDRQSHTWQVHYDPEAAGGNGRITFRLDDEEMTFEFENDLRERGATFDRFGIVMLTGSDGHFVEAYLDDLTYTAGTP